MKKNILLAAALGAGLLFGGAADARVVEKVAAVVGDEVVLQSEVEERAAQALQKVAEIPNAQQRAARATAVRREVLDRLIDEHLLMQQATELKLSVSSEEVDRSVDQVKKDNGLNDVQFRGELQKLGMSMSAYRAQMRREILRWRVINIAVGSKVSVSDNDVQGYYDRNVKAGSNVEVRAAHVFIAIPEEADAAQVRDRESQAKKILERARAGEDFGKLAREHSQDPATREDGGDFGYFGKGMLPKPIEELVFSMSPGDVRGPVRADRGFHVIKLLDRRQAAVKPLADVKEQIREQLRQKEMERQLKNYLSELRKKTLVDVRI